MVRDGPHHTAGKFRYRFRFHNYVLFVPFQTKQKRGVLGIWAGTENFGK